MQWETLSKALAPELHQLVTNWDKLPSDQKGEQAGYVFGKYGADLLIPGVVAKTLSAGVKGASKLTGISNGLKKTEKILRLESYAGRTDALKF